MTPTNYEKGRAAEYKAIRQLRDDGYAVLRTAGSHGMYDVVAWNRHEVLFIQIKRDCKPTRGELAALEAAHVPAGCSKELWTYTTGVGAPEKVRLN
jgi:predicted RNA binding protein YcfA (HicA-like mRNA interferase family)